MVLLSPDVPNSAIIVVTMEASSGVRRSKRRRRDEPPLHFERATFPLLLAACANAEHSYNRRLIKRLLRAHLALITSPGPPPLHQLLPHGLLSLLPLLLVSRFSSVAALSLELVGAAALCSIDANERVASDVAAVNGLLRALESPSRPVVLAACNAVLDLSTSPMGRERLRDSSAIEKLLLLFCQVATVLVNSVSFQDMEKGSNDCLNRGSIKDNLLQLALDAMVILVNTSCEDCLEKIPQKVAEKFLPLVKGLWYEVQGLTFPGDCIWGQYYSCSAKYDLAATMFRLAMNQEGHASYLPDEIRRSIFGNASSDFENFVLSYWEDSPLLIRRESKNLYADDNIFRSLNDSFNLRMTDTVLDSMLQGLVSCPPIASDELDIICFLNEVNDFLGSPIVYGQDIRVLKTQMLTDGSRSEQVKKEVHFFTEKLVSGFTNLDFIQKCKEAFKDGYTIALRGMEFRSHKVAAIADGLANIFGQPSIGANIYLTPPRSQGLAWHSDDHCVFVWQLFGHKQWRILPRPKNFLPRLYEPLGSLPGFEWNACAGMQFLLGERDVLYIPRGYPHEAHTTIFVHESSDDLSMEYSLHLTLGIEVEPPFEWEGFAHVALHCWNEKQKQEHCQHPGSKSDRMRLMFVNLLHVAIRMIADHDSTFRKACMVAALPLTSDAEGAHHADTLAANQRVIFHYIIDRIDTFSTFLEVFKNIEIIVQEGNDGTLQWMRWLRHLPQEGDEHEKIDYGNPLGVFANIVISCREHIEEAIIGFTQVKSNFCRNDVYKDACKGFQMLLEKYRRTRKQYMNGMLSLHSTK